MVLGREHVLPLISFNFCGLYLLSFKRSMVLYTGIKAQLLLTTLSIRAVHLCVIFQFFKILDALWRAQYCRRNVLRRSAAYINIVTLCNVCVGALESETGGNADKLCFNGGRMSAGSPATSQRVKIQQLTHRVTRGPRLHKCRCASRLHVWLLFLCTEPGSHS